MVLSALMELIFWRVRQNTMIKKIKVNKFQAMVSSMKKIKLEKGIESGCGYSQYPFLPAFNAVRAQITNK